MFVRVATLLVCAAAIPAFAQSFFPSGLTRFAGQDTSAFTGDNGPAYYARFAKGSFGLARDKAGAFYIAELARIRKIDTQGIVTTIAGTGVSGSIGDGGPATAAQISPAGGIAIDSHGNVYFGQNATIRRFAPGGTITTIGGEGDLSPVFNGDGIPALSANMHPSGLAVDSRDQLYFADPDNKRVRVIKSDGKVSTVAGTGTSGFAGEGGPASLADMMGPFGLTFDAVDNLYVADSVRVVKIDAGGTLTRIAGIALDLSFGIPFPILEVPALQTVVFATAIALDAAGDVFIAGPSVQKITPDGIIHAFAGAATPPANTEACGDAKRASVSASGTAMVTDPAGNLYLMNALGPPFRLQRVTPAGKISTLAGMGPNRFTGDGGAALSATFASPSGIAFDNTGRLFVADTSNNRIRAIDAGGTVRTVVGEGGPTYDQDPACLPDDDRFLRLPGDVKVDAAGSIYVADTGKNRIRKIEPDGTQTTVAAAAGLNRPSGVAVDTTGNLYIADSGNGRVLKVDAAGNIVTLANVAASGTLTLEKSGSLLIPVATPSEVDRLRPDGMLIPVAGSGELDDPNSNARVEEINRPAAAVSDASGSIYVADSDKHAIQRTSFHCAISADGRSQLQQPEGLAFDSQGNLFIADAAAGAIWRATPTPAQAIESPTPHLQLFRPVRSAAPSNPPPPPFEPDPFHPDTFVPQEPAAPGELIRLSGACLGPFDPVSAAFDANGLLPTNLAGVRVLLNNVPVPLISVSAGDVVGVAPYSVQPTFQGPGPVVLAYQGVVTTSITPVNASYPALFTANLKSSGPALAVNQVGSLYSDANPAPKGSIVLLYGTGTGQTNPPAVDGRAAPADPLQRIALPMFVAIGGVAAEVLFAGNAPGFVGLTQINVRVPASLTGQGRLPVTMILGPPSGISLMQGEVTIAVR
jgi:uncharacterized protein (TIGR03437 family)